MRNIVAEALETLGGIVKGAGKQASQDAKKAVEDVPESLGLKAITPEEENPPAHTDEQYKKIDEAAKKRTAVQYRQIQEEIKQIQDKRKKETPQNVAGSPGFSEEKAIKQLEEKKEDDKKLPPLPAQRSSRKTETFRGTSG
ncbi:hypothetical protein KKA69_01050 [Patescibacteria group bacterium]|nr:hypothetical protein [Patescibacteria group bacterium]